MKCSVVEAQRGGAGVRDKAPMEVLSPGWAADWAELGQAEPNTPLAAPQHFAFPSAQSSCFTPTTDQATLSRHAHPYLLVSCVT